MRAFDTKCGDGVVVLGVPHSGTYLPPRVLANLRPQARALSDTDLVPTADFDGIPIWVEEPVRADIENRLASWHHPYHAALAGELERVHRKHGIVVLVDCHSIRSRIPFLFEGILPDINLGTNLGTSCDERIAAAAVNACRNGGDYTFVRDGRFRGGWTTRHYGRPGKGVHAIQIELAQSNYLESECAPFEYDSAKAERLRSHLRGILRAIEDATTEMGQSHE